MFQLTCAYVLFVISHMIFLNPEKDEIIKIHNDSVNFIETTLSGHACYVIF